MKKIQDKNLRFLYQNVFQDAEEHMHTAGNLKKEDIAGIFVYDFLSRVAYTVENQTITFLLAGTYENFCKV